MDYPSLDTWIGNHHEASEVASAHHLLDPNTEAALAQNRSSSPQQVARAVDAASAQHSRGEWARMALGDRAAVLARFAVELDLRQERIAVLDALNSGVPISMTRMFASSLGDTVRKAVADATSRGEVRQLNGDRRVEVRRVPWGPTVLIAPWNAPAGIATKKLAYALAAGAPVIVKPSPESPWSTEVLFEAAAEVDFPEGLLNLVLGGANVGEALCADPRVRAISMTGSTSVGRSIGRSASPNFTRLQLELGSNNPMIVRADADAADAAKHAYQGMAKLNGQWCEAPRNVFVAAHVLDDFIDALKVEFQQTLIGSSLDTNTTLGPMAFRSRREELLGQRNAWRDAGHALLGDCSMPDRGWFFAPTAVLGENIPAQGEVFGPMITVESFDTDAHAVRMANAKAGGLAAYVCGTDLEAAFDLGRELRAGEVKINGTSLLDMAPDSVQGFFGTSGIGGHGDRSVLDFYSGDQIVGVDLIDPPL